STVADVGTDRGAGRNSSVHSCILTSRDLEGVLMATGSTNTFGAASTLKVGDQTYRIHRLDAVHGDGLDVASLPFSLKILLENLPADDIRALAGWDPAAEPSKEIQFTPARVVMQDFTGVPCVVDLATMREAMAELGGDPARINPLAPAELVIDHSVIADVFGS